MRSDANVPIFSLGFIYEDCRFYPRRNILIIITGEKPWIDNIHIRFIPVKSLTENTKLLFPVLIVTGFG